MNKKNTSKDCDNRDNNNNNKNNNNNTYIAPIKEKKITQKKRIRGYTAWESNSGNLVQRRPSTNETVFKISILLTAIVRSPEVWPPLTNSHVFMQTLTNQKSRTGGFVGAISQSS